MKIKVFYDDIKYRIRNVNKVKELVIKVIRNEGKIPGDLNFILTGDINIRKINREFLKHDNFTDVIAFDYGISQIVSGEIYISKDSVKRNSINYKVSFKEELLRVMVHGTLHLCGYRDKTIKEKEFMHSLEDSWICKYKEW